MHSDARNILTNKDFFRTIKKYVKTFGKRGGSWIKKWDTFMVNNVYLHLGKTIGVYQVAPYKGVGTSLTETTDDIRRRLRETSIEMSSLEYYRFCVC